MDLPIKNGALTVFHCLPNAAGQALDLTKQHSGEVEARSNASASCKLCVAEITWFNHHSMEICGYQYYVYIYI